jgi:serine/threonine-protein kinase RsbW
MSRAVDRLKFHQEAAPERGRTLLSVEMPSDLNLKYAYILRAVESLRTNLPLSSAYRENIELCLDEAIKNAVVWGNRQDPKKKVRLRIWEEEGSWGFTLTDQGAGFGADALPDYESEEFLWLDSGRGIYILLNYLSEVAYYDGGRTLVAKG